MCSECVSRGPDGTAIIGTDKPCVEECTGKGFMGTQGKETRSGNEEEEVTMSTRNAVGEESGVIARILQDHEKETWQQCKNEHEVEPGRSHG